MFVPYIGPRYVCGALSALCLVAACSSEGGSPSPDASEQEFDAGEAIADAGSEQELDAGEAIADASTPNPDPQIDAAAPYDCAQLACDDEDVCTLDACDLNQGCIHTPRSGVFTLDTSSLELISLNGAPVELSVSAMQDDADISACASWTYEGPFATLAANRLSAAPLHGAKGTLSATLADATQSIPVQLKLKWLTNSGDLTDEQKAAFDGDASLDTDGVSLVYPADHTVFPLDAKSPTLQWRNGNAADTYRVRIYSELFEFIDYVAPTAPGRFQIPATMWSALGASGLGKQDPIRIELLRHTSSGLSLVGEQTLRIAQGHINASVHYRELNANCASGYSANGRAVALHVGSEAATDIAAQTTCHGCHAISRDGTQMASSRDGSAPFPFLTWDLRARSDESPLTAYSPMGNNVSGSFGTYNPGGDKFLFSTDAANGASTLSVYDFDTDSLIARNLLGAKCGEPAWSPDGRLVAGICNLTGSGWVFDMSRGDLLLGDMAQDASSVANARVLVAQGNEAGRPSYPDFSPDSQYLIYSRTTAGSRSTGNGRIWLASVDGQHEKALMRLSSQNREFYPRFAPRRAGGYYWVAFTSRRDYGHTKFADAGQRHVWLAAIDEDASELEDPSFPAFYLEGQLSCASAYELQFAREICLPDAQACKLGSDCCSGTCLPAAPDAASVCTTQPEGSCVMRENRCNETSECCGSLACVDGMCQQVD